MTRSLGKLVLTVGTLALLASPAWAQNEKGARGGRGGFGGGMGGGAFFLTAENVQKDMKLSEEQVGKVRETLQDVAEKHRDDFAALRDATPAEQRQKMSALRKTMNDEIKKGISLSAEQSKRFDQIALQQLGSQAFLQPEVASKLNLTDEQKTQIMDINQALRGQQGGGAFNKDQSKEERQEAFRKMAAMRKENLTKIVALLTADQKKEWKELTGEPIELPAFGGGGRGRRPNN